MTTIAEPTMNEVLDCLARSGRVDQDILCIRVAARMLGYPDYAVLNYIERDAHAAAYSAIRSECGRFLGRLESRGVLRMSRDSVFEPGIGRTPREYVLR